MQTAAVQGKKRTSNVLLRTSTLSAADKREEKRLKKNCDRDVQKRAYEHLLSLRAANGGNPIHGDIETVIVKYANLGYTCVTRRNLAYRLELAKNGKTFGKETAPPPVTNITSSENETTISPLTENSAINQKIGNTSNSDTNFNTTTAPTSNSTTTTTSSERRTAGRKSIEAKQREEKSVADAIFGAAEEFQKVLFEYQEKGMKLPNGKLNEIVSDFEKENGLQDNSISRSTVKSRVYRKNIEGQAHQKVSPLLEVEPIIVEYCIELANIGEALTKESVIELMEETIKGTKYEEALKNFKMSRNIEMKNSNSVVGNAWYHGFMKRNNQLVRKGRCLVKDMKRHTWCTYDHFSNMYDSVYDRMVMSGVAEIVEDDIYYDEHGNEVQDVAQMVGRPTKYRLLKPEYCLFVDETGCNTNQKEDGHVGGRRLILPTKKN